MLHVSSMHVGCSNAACKPLTPYVFMGQRMYCISWSRIFVYSLYLCMRDQLFLLCSLCLFFFFSLFQSRCSKDFHREKEKKPDSQDSSCAFLPKENNFRYHEGPGLTLTKRKKERRKERKKEGRKERKKEKETFLLEKKSKGKQSQEKCQIEKTKEQKKEKGTTTTERARLLKKHRAAEERKKFFFLKCFWLLIICPVVSCEISLLPCSKDQKMFSCFQIL